MAVLGRWSAGVTSLIPSTSYTFPNGLFTTEDRNDGSVYSFNSTTSELTLPLANLADGYLMIARVEHDNAGSGARYSPVQDISQITGASSRWIGNPTGGFCQGGSDDRAFTQSWFFVDGPSAGSTYKFRWKRGSAGTGGTQRSSFEVIPLFYEDKALYRSTDHTVMGGTTPNVVTIAAATFQGPNFSRSGSRVTVRGDNKRYLILSNFYWEGRGGRTQRTCGHQYDDTDDLAAQCISFYQDTANDNNGGMVSDLIETNTANRPIEFTCFRGLGIGSQQGGAEIDGNDPALGASGFVILQLYDNAEVFRTKDGTGGQNVHVAGPTDLNISRTTDIDFNDSASWIRATDIGMNAEVAMDALIGTNVWAASEAPTSSTALNSEIAITINGTEDADLFDGNFFRGDFVSQATLGFGANIMGYASLSANDDVGVSASVIGSAHTTQTQAGTVGLWGINLDTLAPPDLQPHFPNRTNILLRM